MPAAGAAEFVPETREVAALAAAVQACRGCSLYQNASRAVFGSGPTRVEMMLVGEQPGDREDLAGEPFVGPAGRLLDRALHEAGLPRAPVYLTNAVKHFKFVRSESGQRRIHKTPSRLEVVACRPWLFAELEAVKPSVVVLLGATAAKSLLGNEFRITAHRGEVLQLPSDTVPETVREAKVTVTVHPSAVLRGPAEAREESFRSLVADLRFAGGLRPA